MPPAKAGRPLVAVTRSQLTGAPDPLTHLLAVMRPRAAAVGAVVGESWRLAGNQAAFCVVAAGRGTVDAGVHGFCVAERGDFILLPGATGFTVAGITPGARCVVGALECDCVDPSLLPALLPPVLHLRGSVRQESVASLLDEAVNLEQLGGAVMADRLLEVMLVEALRQATAGRAPPGLLQGLGDRRLVPALYGIHGRLAHPWTVAELAGLTDLRRSAFHVRFTRRVGASPMGYLLSWRMRVARELMRSWARDCATGARRPDRVPFQEIARSVGYGCVASFIRAFHGHEGQTPGRFMRAVGRASGAGAKAVQKLS